MGSFFFILTESFRLNGIGVSIRHASLSTSLPQWRTHECGYSASNRIQAADLL
jgi:hypothetical protein